jgi:hypothetical protein
MTRRAVEACFGSLVLLSWLLVPPTADAVIWTTDVSTRAYSEEPHFPAVGSGPDPVEGTAHPPQRGPAGVASRIRALIEAQSLDAATTRPLPTTYRRIGYQPVPLSMDYLPYNSSYVRPFDEPVPRDAYGVRMHAIGGKLFDHPVAQASDGLDALNSYRLSGDGRYLDRALADADRLVDRKVVSDDAWYYPYPFDFALHGNPDDMMVAPWFSGMAQGQALSLFVRLHQTTGAAEWRTAADATFATFLNAPVADLPSTVNIDPSGFLWLEEYPAWPLTASDRTLNGHVFAIYGLYDYFRLTSDSRASSLWDGALATTRRYVQLGFLNPSWISHYCLAHPSALSTTYHEIHRAQMVSLHASTKDALFSRLADILRADYPKAAAVGTVIIERGTRYGYKFDSNGNVLASTSMTPTRTTSAPGDRRQRIKGRGIYYRITSGVLAGYWIRESYPSVRMLGERVTIAYPWYRSASIPAGTWSAYQYDSIGRVISVRTIRLSATSSAPFDRSAVINGRIQVRITAGVLAGHWLPFAGITLR